MIARWPWLRAAGWMSVVASLLHVAVIFGGPDWYRFFGAGEEMARAAEQGRIAPTVITMFIAGILATWAAFAFGATGLTRRLPLTRTVLVAIATVLLARAALGLVPSLWAPEQWPAFALWSSGICFVMGACFALGTWLAWPQLSQRKAVS